MTDKPRSIIMPNDPETAIVSTDKLVLTPDEVKDRIEKKSKARYSGPNKYNISRDEAVSIAAQIGQEVYDQLRAEHALTMGELQKDLGNHFGEIRRVVAANILDLQRRSFSYRIRRDFDVDLQRMAAKLRNWWDMGLAWLELHGLREAPKLHMQATDGGPNPDYREPESVDPRVPPDELHVRDAQGNTTQIVNLRTDRDAFTASIDMKHRIVACELSDEPENVGAPTELPEDPEVARAFTLSSQEEGGPRITNITAH